MVNLEDQVQTFAGRTFSELTPSGSRVGKDILRTENYKRKMLEGEASESLYCYNHHVRFGYDSEKNELWTLIEPLGKSPIDKGKLASALQNPELSSGAKIRTRENYEKLVGHGHLDSKMGGGNSIGVRFRVNKNNPDVEKLFEAFLYNFKPATKIIYENFLK